MGVALHECGAATADCYYFAELGGLLFEIQIFGVGERTRVVMIRD